MKYSDLIDEINEVLDRDEVDFTEKKLSLYKLKRIITEDLKQYTYVDDTKEIVEDINKDKFTTGLFGRKKRIDAPKVSFRRCFQSKYSDHSEIILEYYKNPKKYYFIVIHGDSLGEYDKFEIADARFVNVKAKGKTAEKISYFFDRYISVRKDDFSKILTNITKLQRTYDCDVSNDELGWGWGNNISFEGNVSPSIEYGLSLENTSVPNTWLRVDRKLEFEDFTNKQGALEVDRLISGHEIDIFKRTPVMIDSLPKVYKDKVFKK